MSTAHLVRNQDGHYWGRGKRWVDGRDVARVMTFSHQDEAVNTVFELSSKDIGLRCDVLSLNLLEGKLPKLEISTIPLPVDPSDDPSDDRNNEEDLENTPGSPPSEEEMVSNKDEA
jgi:hypothetical protein